jgi:hypothetical protein
VVFLSVTGSETTADTTGPDTTAQPSGAFISEDPLAFGGGDANLYAYVGNDAVDFTDPFGLRPLPDCEKRTPAPFIPKIDLNNADVHPGQWPWYLRWMSKDYDGIIRDNDIYFRSGAYDSTTIARLSKARSRVGSCRSIPGWNDMGNLRVGVKARI